VSILAFNTIHKYQTMKKLIFTILISSLFLNVYSQTSEEFYKSANTKMHDLHDYPGAIKDFDKAIALNPKYEWAYYGRGIAKNLNKEYGAAIADYDTAIMLNQQFAEAYSGRGNSEGRLNENKKAMEDFNKAIEINPKYPEAYLGRGLVKINMRDPAGACNDLKTSADLGSKFALTVIEKFCK
jgi:tetratricopeptide (TPR) repeat protein